MARVGPWLRPERDTPTDLERHCRVPVTLSLRESDLLRLSLRTSRHLQTCVSLRAQRVLLLTAAVISFSVSLLPLHWKDSPWAQAAGQHDPGGSSLVFSSGTPQLFRCPAAAAAVVAVAAVSPPAGWPCCGIGGG